MLSCNIPAQDNAMFETVLHVSTCDTQYCLGKLSAPSGSMLFYSCLFRTAMMLIHLLEYLSLTGPSRQCLST